MLIPLRPRSPLKRYFSHASSLPDYGAPDGSMAKGHLVGSPSSQNGLRHVLNIPKKKLNAAPISSLNTLNRRAGQAALSSSDVLPQKRSRRDSTQSATLERSRYFPPNRQQRRESEIQDGSIEEPFDVRSQSSAGNATQMSAGVPEYRTAQVDMVGGRRQKRRRLLLAHDKRFFPASTSPDSPDVLAEDDMDDPSRANVISDPSNTRTNDKRGRPISHVEILIKRPRPAYVTTEEIQDSEDELAPTNTSTPGSHKKRRLTNFDSVDSRETKRRSLTKGDITPTKFGSSKKPAAQRKSDRIAYNLSGAVTGKELWEPSPKERAQLIFEDTILRFCVNGRLIEESPFEIELSSVRVCAHAITKSPLVAIQRRSSSGKPPQMWLHFESDTVATKFLGRIPFRQCIDEEREPSKLEKEFQHQMQVAKGYQGKSGSHNGISQMKIRSDAHGLDRCVSQSLDESMNSMRGELRQEDFTRPRREKLVEKLARSATDLDSTFQDLSEAYEAPHDVQFTGRALRSKTGTARFRRTSPGVDIPEVRLDPWTHENPGWRAQWGTSLIYPATGKNRTTVDAEDIVRLDEGEFLNDNLISFYLRYLQVEVERERPEVLKKVHIFSSFFYEKLKSTAKYEGVKSWTAKIDLFSYDYIVVPVNEHAHWYLAIICNVGQTLPGAQLPEHNNTEPQNGSTGEMSSSQAPGSSGQVQSIPIEDDLSSPHTVGISDDVTASPSTQSPERFKPRRSIGGSLSKVDTKAPKIITLDSLDGSHSATCKTLKTYLENEARDKKGVELASVPGGMKGKDVPGQDNHCDCGVFVLGYMEEFLKDPDEAARRLLQKERLEWNIRPQHLRNKVRSLLFDLQKQQQSRQTEELAKKKILRAQKKAAAAATSEPSNNNSASQSRGPSSSPAISKPASPDPAKSSPAEKAPVKEPMLQQATPKSPVAASSAPVEASTDDIVPTVEHLDHSLPLAPDPLLKTQSPTIDSESLVSRVRSSSSEASGQAFYSAPSSPENSARLRVDLPSPSGMVDGIPILKKTSSSDSEVASASLSQKKRKKKKGRKKGRKGQELEHHIQPSIEKDDQAEMVSARIHSPELVPSDSEANGVPTVKSFFTLV